MGDLREIVEDYIEAEGTRILGNERLGYLPQELQDKDKEKSIYEYFSEMDCFWNQTPKDLGEYANKFGVSVDFFYSEQKLVTLSGGEKVKVQLMKLLMQEPTVLLLDEPSNDIDIACLTGTSETPTAFISPLNSENSSLINCGSCTVW